MQWLSHADATTCCSQAKHRYSNPCLCSPAARGGCAAQWSRCRLHGASVWPRTGRAQRCGLQACSACFRPDQCQHREQGGGILQPLFCSSASPTAGQPPPPTPLTALRRCPSSSSGRTGTLVPPPRTATAAAGDAAPGRRDVRRSEQHFVHATTAILRVLQRSHHVSSTPCSAAPPGSRSSGCGCRRWGQSACACAPACPTARWTQSNGCKDSGREGVEVTAHSAALGQCLLLNHMLRSNATRTSRAAAGRR